MNSFGTAVTCMLGLAVLADSASSEITQCQTYAAQERFPRPGRIHVYHIRATPADIPATAAITGYYSRRQSPQTATEVKLGRRLGAQVAHGLVPKILDMGLPAQRSRRGPPPQFGDVLITGQFVSIDEGNRTKRVIIGFGNGSGEFKTHVESYLVTSRGHRLLGARDICSAGGKTPGVLVPGIVAVATFNPAGLIVSGALKIKKKRGSKTMEGAAKRITEAIAKELKTVFRRQGWI